MIQPRLEGLNVAPGLGSAGFCEENSHSHQGGLLLGLGSRFSGWALAPPQGKELLEVCP